MELQYSTRDLARAAVIAAAYAALAWISNFFGLAFPAIQFRLSEALCVLPCRDRKAAIPGLAVGCLITNLLSLSRADRAKLILEPLDLSKLTTSIGQQYQKAIAHTLKISVEPDLKISGNEDTLKKIIVALLDNADKYSPDNKPFTLRLKANDQNVQLEVADQGIGIPDDKKPLVFQRFYRVDTSHSTEIKGSGLGLSIVSQLVKLNNGQITVFDNQPQGSIFRVTFEKS